MNSELITSLKNFHRNFKILGQPQASLLEMPKPLLVYLLSILRNDTPLPCPKASENEWAYLISELGMHGLIPFLYTKIAQLPAECQPPVHIKRIFRKDFLKNNLAYQSYLRQLREILSLSDRASFDVIVLKGLALAWTVYPHFAERPFGDIDLLVNPDQFNLVRNLLIDIGYRNKFKRYEIYKEICKAEEFFHGSDRRKALVLDLHWNLFHYYGIWRNGWTADVFHKKEPVKVPGISFYTLNPVDAFIHAAIHLTLNHDEGIRLIWVADLAYLSQKLSEIDEWSILCRKVEKLKTGLAIQYALQAAQYWFNSQVPARFVNFLKTYKPDKDERLEIDYAIGRCFSNIRLRGYFKAIRQAPKDPKFLLQFLFPDPAYMRNTYPPHKTWLLTFSYFKRWAHWIKELFFYTYHRMKRKLEINALPNKEL